MTNILLIHSGNNLIINYPWWVNALFCLFDQHKMLSGRLFSGVSS